MFFDKEIRISSIQRKIFLGKHFTYKYFRAAPVVYGGYQARAESEL